MRVWVIKITKSETNLTQLNCAFAKWQTTNCLRSIIPNFTSNVWQAIYNIASVLSIVSFLWQIYIKGKNELCLTMQIKYY